MRRKLMKTLESDFFTVYKKEQEDYEYDDDDDD